MTLRAALLASAALALGGFPALAQDATWHATPGSTNFNAGANWNTGTRPTGTAFFGTSTRTNLSFANDVTIGGWTFNANAANYTFNNNRVLEFTGAGIVINGGSATISNSGELYFRNGSSAGTASITNTFFTEFYGTSTAGNATITNQANLLFYDDSSAGSATITNNNSGLINFHTNSTAGNASITNNANLSFYDNSKAGSATITNKSSLIFYDSSSADGATIVNESSLIFRGFSTAGTATITTTAGATTQFIAAGSSAGARFITQAGGTVDISDPAGFSAMTAGSIEGAGNYVIGAKQFTVGSNNLSTEVSGVISGAGGALIKTGTGTLTLTGTNTYTGGTTISAGALQIGNGGTTGSITGDIVNNAQLVFNRSDAVNFGGQISGSGGVTKIGSGTLTLTGAHTYGGGTTVSSGKLVVNGSIAGAVTIDGGALGGSGTIGALAVVSGGTVAPGNSIGTLKVSGNVAFAAGSTYQVEINPAGQGDRIAATGSATITGGTVQVLAEAGNYAANTTYTILTAAGGVTGRFSSVTSNLVFLAPSLAYDATNVTLTMTRTATSFGPDGGPGGSSPGGFVAATRNQGFIAGAAERLGAGNAVYDTLLSGTAAEARAGFDLLSGEAHAQGVSVMIDESRLVRETILSRLRGPLLTAPAGQVAASFSADLPGRKGAVTMPAPVPQPRYALWGEAFGGTGNTNADGNAGSLSRRSGGALLGADMLVYEAPGSSLKLGVAGGYSQSRFDLDARRSSGKLDSGHAALYAGARFGNWRLDAGVAYSWSESDIRRQVAIRGFGDALRLQRPGAVAQGFAELGYGFAFSGFALEPFAQLALIRVSTDAGTERGGAAALRVLSSEQTLGFTTLGLRAEAQIGAMPLFARAMLGWRHGFGELTPTAKTAFATGTTPAQVFAARIDRDALTAEAGLDWRISSATALGLTYSAAIGERSRDHALKGRVEMRF